MNRWKIYLPIFTILFGLEDINAYLLASQETIDREFGNLNVIPDQYPKYVISMDPIGGEVEGYPGIMHVRLRDFLKMTF